MGKPKQAIGLVVNMLDSQSGDPGFKTTGWLQVPFQGQLNEYQEVLVT